VGDRSAPARNALTIVDPKSGVKAVIDGVMSAEAIPHGPPDRVDGRADSACHIPRRQRQWIKAAQLTGTPPAGGPTLMMADEIFCSEAWARLDPANARTGCRSVQTAWGTTRVGASKPRTPRRPPPWCGLGPG